ncbi:hypothetical protein [Elizabethkingia anophelis]|uniref:Uncharacterized protein n=1 Tax=Elizabethkingia anophelis TaxID=1117645 RepID=A0A7Z7LYX4_9FLAO|nr:hypothetical protein [Elizabethkingia anophelis]MCT3628815.1 hypothetical protein [Elizabethkingia anophelis]MCT3632247.1 hypothetical protein [Elizabethkingia anophelis]MCT3718524.1 hypothetical protein [Elizabethkingia anophelis]MCT3722034.1 hypothetical protein [Elizabethkingia anophelis]MCT3725748.1 hypothetical protein [Elizabethkingia anophelis]
MKKTKRDEMLFHGKKHVYIPPVFEIVLVEMEAGISATSALVKPDTTVQTDWEGTDTQTGEIIWE